MRVLRAAGRHEKLGARRRRQRGPRLVDERVPVALSAFLDDDLVVVVLRVVDGEVRRAVFLRHRGRPRRGRGGLRSGGRARLRGRRGCLRRRLAVASAGSEQEDPDECENPVRCSVRSRACLLRKYLPPRLAAHRIVKMVSRRGPHPTPKRSIERPARPPRGSHDSIRSSRSGRVLYAAACSGAPAQPASAPVALRRRNLRRRATRSRALISTSIPPTRPRSSHRPEHARARRATPKARGEPHGHMARLDRGGRGASQYPRRRARAPDAGGKPVVTVFVVYDLPERDCSAGASSGELALAERRRSPVQEGVHRAPGGAVSRASIAAHRRGPRTGLPGQHRHEPGGRAVRGRRRASTAARSRARCSALSMPNVWLYLDAAHAGWLGWARNSVEDRADLPRRAVEAGGAGQDPGVRDERLELRYAAAAADIARLEPSDPCPDELTYVEKLAASLAEVGIVGQGIPRSTRAATDARASSRSRATGATSPARGWESGRRRRPPRASTPTGGSSPPATPTEAPTRRARLRRELRPATPPTASAGAPAGQWFPAQLLQLIDRPTRRLKIRDPLQ